MQRRARAAWIVVFIIATAAGAVPATASAANTVPECHGSVFTVAPGGSRALPLTCTDVDHQPRVLSYETVGDPAGGSLGEVNHTTSTVRFTADSGFSGTTTVSFQAYDGGATSAVAEHEIRVTSAQQTPVCDTTAVEAIDGYATFTPCSDPDASDAVSVEVLDPPAHGTATVYGASVSYVAGAFRGVDAIRVRASDGTRTSDPTTIPIEVTDATAPECEPRGTIPVRPDRIKRLGLRCWDNLPRWNPWSSFEEIEPPLRGTFRGSWDGGWSYDPDPGFTSGTDRAVVRPIGSTTRAGAPIELNFTVGADANEPPQCVTWPARPVRPGRETIAVSCTDPDDDPLTLTLTDPPEKGTFTAATETGGFGTYLADDAASGADHLAVEASDGRGGSSPPVVQHFSIVPDGENHAPVCFGQAHHAVQGFDAFVSATCLGDEENDPFTTALAPAEHDALTDLGGGLWRYVSAPAFVGTDAFTMTASDERGASTPTSVRMLVRAPVVPQCPQRAPRTVRTGVFTYLDLTCTDDAGRLEPVLTDEPEHGEIVNTHNGFFGYQSDPGYEGPDEFTVTATNDHGAVVRTQEVTVDEDFNTAPVCSVEPEVFTRQVAVDLTARCDDDEGDVATHAITDDPDHGTITDFDPIDGTLTYTPHVDFVGRDSFAVTGTDTRGAASEPAVQKIVVRDADRNLAPDCTTAEHWVEKGMTATISEVCSDPDRDPITLTIVDQPEHGDVTLTPDGWPIYAAPSNFTGAETFAVTASDGTLASDPVTITMNVTGQRGTPSCSPIAFTATAGVARSVDLACAPWGGGGPGMTIEIVDGPAHGTLSTVTADRKVTYTPHSGYAGADTFRYRAREGDHVSAIVNATITVVKPAAPTQPAQPAPTQPAPTTPTGTTGTTTGGTLLTPSAGLVRPVAPLPGLPAAAPSLSVQELAARALGASARLARGLKLGRIRAYIPSGRAAVRGRSTPLLALICPTSSCSATVRPRLELGRRRTTLRTQRLRFGAGRPGAAVLRLSASQLRALKRARRGRVRFTVTAGKRRGTVSVPVASVRR